MQRRLAVILFGFASCRATAKVATPIPSATQSKHSSSPSTASSDGPDYRAHSLKVLRARTSGGGIEFTTGPVTVGGNELSCTCPNCPQDRDGDSMGPLEEGVEAFLVSPNTCLVHVTVRHDFCSHPEIVIELSRTPTGWSPLTCGLWWNRDVVAIDESGRRADFWSHPRHGEIRVDGADPDVNAPIRCDLQIFEGMKNGSETSVLARFQVVPKLRPDELPFIVERFIEFAHVDEPESSK